MAENPEIGLVSLKLMTETKYTQSSSLNSKDLNLVQRKLRSVLTKYNQLFKISQ